MITAILGRGRDTNDTGDLSLSDEGDTVPLPLARVNSS